MKTTMNKKIKISLLTLNSKLKTVLSEDMRTLRGIWEETSYQLERLQVNPDCADNEKKNIYDRRGPQFKITFKPGISTSAIINNRNKTFGLDNP